VTLPGTVVIKSTSDLTPNGILGYAKALSGLAGLLGGALAVILPLIDPNTTWARYVGGAIAVLGFLGTYQFPNAVKPVEVPPPAVNVEPTAEEAPPPIGAIDPLLGVLDPPGKHEEQ
jgi:hypothetical protein